MSATADELAWWRTIAYGTQRLASEIEAYLLFDYEGAMTMLRVSENFFKVVVDVNGQDVTMFLKVMQPDEYEALEADMAGFGFSIDGKAVVSTPKTKEQRVAIARWVMDLLTQNILNIPKGQLASREFDGTEVPITNGEQLVRHYGTNQKVVSQLIAYIYGENILKAQEYRLTDDSREKFREGLRNIDPDNPSASLNAIATQPTEAAKTPVSTGRRRREKKADTPLIPETVGVEPA